MGVIYKIEHKKSHKIYIGQTRRTFEDRLREHLRPSSKHHINFALRKYGIDNFYLDIIEEVEDALLNEREKYWIKYYNCVEPNGYNNTYGGEGGVPSEYTRRKISETLKSKHFTHTDEFKIQMSKRFKGRVSPMKGRKHSKETLLKMIEQRSGENSKVAKPIICLETGVYYISTVQASDQTGVGRSCLCCALKGTQKTAGGLHWVYADDL